MPNDMFIKIGKLAGESVDKAHAGEIDVLSWSWGASNTGSAHVGVGAGSGKCDVQDLAISKYCDKSSPALMLATCAGTHFDTAVLVVRKAGDKPLEYLKITLTKVLVSSVSYGASGEDRLTENVTLNFGTVAFEYMLQKADGGKGDVFATRWDVAQNSSD